MSVYGLPSAILPEGRCKSGFVVELSETPKFAVLASHKISARLKFIFSRSVGAFQSRLDLAVAKNRRFNVFFNHQRFSDTLVGV